MYVVSDLLNLDMKILKGSV